MAGWWPILASVLAVALVTGVQGQPLAAKCTSWYEVQAGDSCNAIAVAANMSTGDFFHLNPDIPESCSTLQIGQFVCLRVSNSTTCGGYYTVREGDICIAITSAFGIPLAALYAMNPVINRDCTNLEVGQRVCVRLVPDTGGPGGPPLTLPPEAPDSPPAPSTTSPAIADGTCTVTHVVVPGDTCYGIVSKHGETTLDALYTLNPFVNSGCTNLQVGQVLCLAQQPSSTPIPAPAPPAPAVTTAAPPSSSGLSMGAIVGIAVGAGCAVVLAGVLLLLTWRVARRKRKQPGDDLSSGMGRQSGKGDGEHGAEALASIRIGDAYHDRSDGVCRSGASGPSAGKPSGSMPDQLSTGTGSSSIVGLRVELAGATGLYAEDPFIWALTSHFRWSSEAIDGLVAVEEGVSAAPLAATAGRPRSGGSSGDLNPPPATAPGPEPEALTAAQVQEQLVLLSKGLLGSGATAGVFKCLWPAKFGNNALLACKVMRAPQTADSLSRLLSSFQYEAALLSALWHPNVVRLYGYCLEPPNVCLIMELLPYSLRDLLYDIQSGSGAAATTVAVAAASGGAGNIATSQPAGVTTPTAAGSLQRAKSVGSPGEPSARSAILTARPSVPSVAESNTSTGAGARSAGSTNVSAVGSSSIRSRSGTLGLLAREPSIKTPHLMATERLTPRTVCLLNNLEVLQIARDVAAGLAHLHALPSQRVLSADGGFNAELNKLLARVMHRDLKPANILIASNRVAKISDFGLAREHQHTTYHTNYGAVGTLRYMAPELLVGALASKVTSQVDIYSLAVILWELAAQQVPWKDVTDMQVHLLVQQGSRPHIPPLPRGDAAPLAPAQVAPPHSTAVPWGLLQLPAYAHLVEACWQGSPGSRPVAAEVLRQLQALVSALESSV